MLGNKFRLFGTVICQYRDPTFYRMVYKLPKLCKLLWGNCCLEFRVSFSFHNCITDTTDYIVTTTSCRFERTFNAAFDSNYFLQILIEFYQ